MKAGGSIIIFPIIGLFFRNIKELYFSFALGFWPAKAISIMIKGDINYLSYNQYYFIGLLYMVILNILSYKLFINKTRLG
jgi:fluoroquinolone transport system permease protein